MLFPKRRKPRIGLVLNGGGARGPYQIGVWLAMRKYGLTSNIVGISGSSVGTFMEVLFLYDDPVKIIKLWHMIDNQTIKSQKSNIVYSVARTALKKRGLYSRSGLKALIDKNIDLHQQLMIKKPVFVSVAECLKNGKGKIVDYKPAYFRLNGLPSEDIETLLLASSAIPLVFDPVEYKGKTYVDPMKADNEPYKPLMDYDFDMLFIIPLNDGHLPKIPRYAGFPKIIVDFASPAMMKLPLMNMIDFSQEMTDSYISEGYQAGKMLLSYIKNRGMLHAETHKQRKTMPKEYYSLHSMGIDDITFAKMKVRDILDDVSKGEEK